MTEGVRIPGREVVSIASKAQVDQFTLTREGRNLILVIPKTQIVDV
jgi:hypothetical protein